MLTTRLLTVLRSVRKYSLVTKADVVISLSTGYKITPSVSCFKALQSYQRLALEWDTHWLCAHTHAHARTHRHADTEGHREQWNSEEREMEWDRPAKGWIDEYSVRGTQGTRGHILHFRNSVRGCQHFPFPQFLPSWTHCTVFLCVSVFICLAHSLFFLCC